ncbi:MAG: hypothetical protein J6252_05700 [Clostridia bacterium]|nr:hypothetical protein [Clostridia bacterium]
MRKKTAAKLKSNKGASLIIALLLFLICTVVGAVVLASATASAGRVSKLAEMDKRYYKVTSAAELLAKNLCGKEVRIVRTGTEERITETEFTVAIDANGEEQVSKGQPSVRSVETYTTAVNPTDTSPNLFDGSYEHGGFSFLTERAVRLMFGSEEVNSAAAMNYSFSRPESGAGNRFTITHEDPGLNAEVEWKTESDGTLVFRISDGAAKDNFSVILTLTPSISDTESTETSDNAYTVRTEGGYKETLSKTVTLKKTSVIKWSVASIEKEAPQQDESN